MTLGFGEDFRNAFREPLYQARNGQAWWVTGLLFLAALIAYMVFQTISALVMVFFVELPEGVSSVLDIFNQAERFQSVFAKATVAGLLPAAILGMLVVWLFTKVANPARENGMPLHLPNLGIAGWFTTISGFLVLMWLFFIATYLVLGIDPKTYSPNDPNSMSGLVEKAVADLADEPFLLALAVPAIALAVPILEELMFRGPLFSALRQTPVGGFGAVVITAAAWALIHMSAPWLFVFVIFFMGLVLGLMLLRFGSITVTIVAHCVWNLLTTIFITSGLQS
jgi:membrane protease YdiL (CAAX protease family)